MYGRTSACSPGHLSCTLLLKQGTTWSQPISSRSSRSDGKTWDSASKMFDWSEVRRSACQAAATAMPSAWAVTVPGSCSQLAVKTAEEASLPAKLPAS